MKKIVLTGGGTLGHVTPHLAIIPRLREAGYEIHYIGTENGMEAPKMRAVEGVTYHAVKSGKLRRYHSWQNFTDPFRVIAGAFQSARLMGKIKPDVVFSKGGFVAVPVVFGAWLHRIPVLCHQALRQPLCHHLPGMRRGAGKEGGDDRHAPAAGTFHRQPGKGPGTAGL